MSEQQQEQHGKWGELLSSSKLLEGYVLWDAIETDLRQGNRYAPDSSKVIEGLVRRCLNYKRERSKGEVFYRARIMPLGHDKSVGPYPPNSTEVGAPPPAKTVGGRLNPMGIPYLYLASSPETAIDEVRGWPHALMTVASFELQRNCELVSLRELYRFDDGLVSWLAFTLSRPADRRDQLVYVASQYIAEHIKAAGADGIEYLSSFGPRGRNVALFDPALAKCVETRLFEVEAVKVSIKEVPSQEEIEARAATLTPPGEAGSLPP